MPQPTQSWDQFIQRHPSSHILQTTGWGETKSRFGWQPIRLISQENDSLEIGAQILFRHIPLGFRIGYIPKGPIFSDPLTVTSSIWSLFWQEIDEICQEKRCIFIKVEPDGWESPLQDHAIPAWEEYRFSPDFQPGFQDIQPRRTLVVELTQDEEAVLRRMKQKTRYNIRLAEKKGVEVYPSQDLETFYRMMSVTGQRDRFGIHSYSYFQTAYQNLHPPGFCELFMAFYAGKPLAGIMVFALGTRAWYFYGASSDEMRELMPTYLLQWEAMRWAISKGCTEYDLWGVPDCDANVLEENFTERSQGLWGVYRFKRGFGGILQRSAGSWDKIYNPVLYRLYKRWAVKRSPMIG